MCGITGYFEKTALSYPLASHPICQMTRALYHRGPDGGDVWIDHNSGIAFGHRRLAIIDTSKAGAQPMISSCGRLVITYNGEVYNKDELKAKLLKVGRCFRGYSDTEVILEACAEWGVEQTVKQLIGMFAFAIWDKRDRSLSLVRDRLGIKPLYWGQQNGLFVFASELKSIRALKQFPTSLNLKAVQAYLSYNYIPADMSVYSEVHKLKPATIMTFKSDRSIDFKTYWSVAESMYAGQQTLLKVADEEAIDDLEALLTDAVQKRMISDVPLGAFLSGGVDSSTVVALMQKSSSSAVKTFSIGFSEAGYNEAEVASRIAAHLNTDHTEFYISAKECLDVIPKLPCMFDEPFSDASQIPTYLVSALTQNHVTVALSGDGGDELFAGYERYARIQKLQTVAAYLPQKLRCQLAYVVMKLPVPAWNGAFKYASGHALKALYMGDKVHKLASFLSHDVNRMYTEWLTHWGPAPAGIDDVASCWEYTKMLTENPIERMQYTDMMTYLPDDILTKVDRASMATSLEVRVPMIDHRVVEFSWRLPFHQKLRGKTTKWILRQVLNRYVPSELTSQPKKGFAVPIDHWLRGPIQEWAEDMLAESALKKYNLVNISAVREKWHEHKKGERNWQFLLWDILMLQCWCDEWIS